MRKLILPVGFALIFLIGLSVLLYPLISSTVNSITQTTIANNYMTGLKKFSEKDLSDVLEAAQEYNRRLRFKDDRFMFSDEDTKEYFRLLNPNNNGIMGVLEIASINVNLPIYHGTDEGVLQVGAGHFEGSSLPVGGPSTHSSITGHTGLPSSVMLNKLDTMVKGDTFVLKILNDVLTYKVDQILIVEPTDTGSLAIETGKDYCTLITCTPYGINSHRLVVRGYRIGNAEESESDPVVLRNRYITVPSEASRANSTQIALIMLSPVLIIILIYLFFKYRKIYGRRNSI